MRHTHQTPNAASFVGAFPAFAEIRPTPSSSPPIRSPATFATHLGNYAADTNLAGGYVRHIDLPDGKGKSAECIINWHSLVELAFGMGNHVKVHLVRLRVYYVIDMSVGAVDVGLQIIQHIHQQMAFIRLVHVILLKCTFFRTGRHSIA